MFVEEGFISYVFVEEGVCGGGGYGGGGYIMLFLLLWMNREFVL